ncbi:MAG: UDP-N-acetylglucosamine 2-epimerase [Flavobacteriales bacterium]|nr:UDP-N-acetylglucosamine 2-epimerase [Flavobacteriales bacterium]
MKKLLVVVGTRPNFVKVTRFKEVARARGDFSVELVHTGQHTDVRMSTVFFEQFGLAPDHTLVIPGGSPAARLGHLIVALEAVIRSSAPDAVVVVGDVDSTLAAALAADRLRIPLVHVESGLRNGDMTMIEEMNRITHRPHRRPLFHHRTERCGEPAARGQDPDSIHFVGNTMIDTLVAFEDRIAASGVLGELELTPTGPCTYTPSPGGTWTRRRRWIGSSISSRSWASNTRWSSRYIRAR